MGLRILGLGLLMSWITLQAAISQAATVLVLSDAENRDLAQTWTWQTNEKRSESFTLATHANQPLQAFLVALPQGNLPIGREKTLALMCRQPQIVVIVAYGFEVAESAARECDKPLLVLQVCRSQFSLLQAVASRKVNSIYLEADPKLNLLLVKTLLPKTRTVGILVPLGGADWIKPLQGDANRLGLQLVQVHVATDLDAARELRAQLSHFDAVLLPPEPSLVNEWSLKPLLLMTIRQGIPTFGGLTAQYVKAGVLAAVVADEARLLEQVNQAVKALVEGHQPISLYPAAVRVEINPTVAHTLGLSMDALEQAQSLFSRP